MSMHPPLSPVVEARAIEFEQLEEHVIAVHGHPIGELMRRTVTTLRLSATDWEQNARVYLRASMGRVATHSTLRPRLPSSALAIETSHPYTRTPR
jgi:hypothetical protein